MNRLLNFLCMGALVCALGMSGAGCDDPEPLQPQEDPQAEVPDYSNRYVNPEDLPVTISTVNRFLNTLSPELDAEQRAQALVDFLKSSAGVIDARILYNEYGRRYNVFFSFMDGPIERELSLDFSSTGMVLSYHYGVVVRVAARTERYYTIDKVFDFINLLGFEVDDIIYGTYGTTMTSNEANLQLIKEALAAKPYVRPYGHIHYLTGQIDLYPDLYGMHNREYQADWLNTMVEFKLTEPFLNENDGHLITFVIPEDATIPKSHWEELFAQYDFLKWVDLLPLPYIIADNTMSDGYEDGFTAVDSKIHISSIEIYNSSPRKFQLHCTTKKQYSSGSHPIIVAKQISSGTVDISFKGVAETGTTDDIGPAKATIDLGALAKGTYTLNLYNGGVKQTGKLIVTAEGYTIEMAENDTFSFTNK